MKISPTQFRQFEVVHQPHLMHSYFIILVQIILHSSYVNLPADCNAASMNGTPSQLCHWSDWCSGVKHGRLNSAWYEITRKYH